MADPVTIGVGVGWGMSILGWVVSPIISKLVNKGLDYLGVAGSSAKNVHNLEKKILHLKLMLEAAQASPENVKKLEPWLKQLKSAFYDAEDILDEIDYHSLFWDALMRHQPANTTKQKATAKKGSKLPGLKDKLRKALKEIEELIDEGQTLLPLLRLTTSGDNTKSSPEQTMGSGSPSKTTSEPPKVFGRDEDAKKIISMLHGDTAADYSVIGIHGISGSGKTTLAQYVCECLKKKNSGVPYFELIMWIHVTKNFSVHTIYNEMLEIVLGTQKDKFNNLDMLQSELKKSLKGKKFLLVLDDVWYPKSIDEQNNMEKLLSPLKEADKGSRVLVTTRTADAAKLLGAQNPMPISDMDEEEFFKMFMHYALDESLVRDQDKGKFETIGREISLLLRKSPLAARTVAGQLRIRTRRAENIGFWIDTLNRKGDLLKDAMGALWWSYHQLDEYVRQCFAYCSMFPRRYELEREVLVKMWMAQGFMDTSKNSDMEVAACECFEVLLSTSFIQLKPNGYYTIHDLLHDLAGIVAGSDCFRIEDDMVNHQIPQDVRHLFIDSDNLGEFIEQIVKLDNLRTLVMSHRYILQLTTGNFQRILKDLKKLRFVSVKLEFFGANVIPECIGDLKHLRYLSLAGISYEHIDLPPAFTKLYHLQELSVHSEVRCLDSSHMADLENLRRINCHSAAIPDIRRMPWLQTLGYFTVKKEKGYEITQLEKLDNIRGRLIIKGLENIKSKEDAHRANLINKVHISSLEFVWRKTEVTPAGHHEEAGSSSRKKQKTTAGHHQQEVTPPKPEDILEALHPPALLDQLSIENYGGSTFPSWLSGEEDGKLKHLKCLIFDNCHGSGSQLKFGKTLPGLHKLSIAKCTWNALPDNIEQLASLEELTIDYCENIRSLPGLPSSLKILETTECENIKTLPELPASLEELTILDCKNIQSLPELPASLKNFWINFCPNIKTLPELPRSLKFLQCEKHVVDSYPDRQAIDRIKVEYFEDSESDDSME